MSLAAAVCRDVAELSGRTSPDDNTDMMLVTAEELTEIINRNMEIAVDAPPVEYRMPGEPPTKPGWYYARWMPSEADKAEGIEPGEIEPVRVEPNMDVVMAGWDFFEALPLSNFTWFGPLPEVREG